MQKHVTMSGDRLPSAAAHQLVVATDTRDEPCLEKIRFSVRLAISSAVSVGGLNPLGLTVTPANVTFCAGVRGTNCAFVRMGETPRQDVENRARVSTRQHFVHAVHSMTKNKLPETWARIARTRNGTSRLVSSRTFVVTRRRAPGFRTLSSKLINSILFQTETRSQTP
jgi:hypothetical protein